MRIILVGNSGVGKTELARVYCGEKFEPSRLVTVMADHKQKQHDQLGQLDIYALPGEERKREIAKTYARGADKVILVYDVTNKESFDAITETWQGFVKKHCPQASVILVANKVDNTERAVTTTQGEELASELGYAFMETSAKEGLNLEEAFTEGVNAPVHQSPSTPLNFERFRGKVYDFRVNNWFTLVALSLTGVGAVGLLGMGFACLIARYCNQKKLPTGIAEMANQKPGVNRSDIARSRLKGGCFDYFKPITMRHPDVESEYRKIISPGVRT